MCLVSAEMSSAPGQGGARTPPSLPPFPPGVLVKTLLKSPKELMDARFKIYAEIKGISIH